MSYKFSYKRLMVWSYVGGVVYWLIEYKKHEAMIKTFCNFRF